MKMQLHMWGPHPSTEGQEIAGLLFFFLIIIFFPCEKRDPQMHLPNGQQPEQMDRSVWGYHLNIF